MSFNQHNAIIGLMESCHVNVGVTCKDIDTVRKMNEVLSTTLHNDLIQTLRKGDHPITIIADGTTTAISNHHFMSVIFQFCSENDETKKIEVRVVQYRLLHLPNANDGTAENQFKNLIKHFKDDQIYGLMKKNTIGTLLVL